MQDGFIYSIDLSLLAFDIYENQSNLLDFTNHIFSHKNIILKK